MLSDPCPSPPPRRLRPFCPLLQRPIATMNGRGERSGVCGVPSAHLPLCHRRHENISVLQRARGLSVRLARREKHISYFFKKIACGIGGKTITYILRVWQLTSCTNRSSRLAYFVIFSISLRRTSISLLKFKSFPGRIGTRNGRRREHCRKRSQKALLLRGITVLQFQKHSKKQNQHRT